MNIRMVWSSDNGFVKYYIVQGAKWTKCLDNSCTTGSVCLEEFWSVRCCADTNAGDWMQKVHCSVFAWYKVPDCSTADWETAVGVCEEAGGRPCIREELEMNVLQAADDRRTTILCGAPQLIQNELRNTGL